MKITTISIAIGKVIAYFEDEIVVAAFTKYKESKTKDESGLESVQRELALRTQKMRLYLNKLKTLSPPSDRLTRVHELNIKYLKEYIKFCEAHTNFDEKAAVEHKLKGIEYGKQALAESKRLLKSLNQ